MDPAADMPALAEGVAAGDAGQHGRGRQPSRCSARRRRSSSAGSNADDSLTHTIYVLRAGSVDAGAVVFANGTRAIDLCGRGTTTLDGATVCV